MQECSFSIEGKIALGCTMRPDFTDTHPSKYLS